MSTPSTLLRACVVPVKVTESPEACMPDEHQYPEPSLIAPFATNSAEYSLEAVAASNGVVDP